ncbi:MAG: isoprenylcysteine carboxylmethyltransferase family protein [Chthoniobacteraceae bacterium]
MPRRISTDSPPPPSTPSAPLANRIFAGRLWIGLAVVGVAAFVVRPRHLFENDQRLLVPLSLGLILLGLAVRTWAGGCAGLHTRTARIEAPQLVTSGPFAYVRNPIYLASVILGLGMVLLIGDPFLFALYLAVFAFLYGFIVPAEERFLRNKFGDSYDAYCRNVPRILPRSKPWPGRQPGGFDPRALWGEARLGLVLAGIYGGLQVAAWLRA